MLFLKCLAFILQLVLSSFLHFSCRKCSAGVRYESTPVSVHWGISIQYPQHFKVEIEFKVFHTLCFQSRQPQIRLNNSVGMLNMTI